jgi:rfaE bifunctional protein nucleotidyltransferase chain/domain
MIVTREELARLLEEERRRGRRIVFTNGCFDILHLGHLRSLEAARAQGDILVVGINSDTSVRRLKGKGRPIHRQAERAALLAGLKPVDYVVVFDEDTPIETIRALRPDVHVKGGDYKVEDLPEREAVEGYGGRIVIVPLVTGYSTTKILERLRRGPGERTVTMKKKGRRSTRKA